MDCIQNLNNQIEHNLYYGYNPGCDQSGLPDYINASLNKEKNTDETVLVDQGYDTLRTAISDELNDSDSETHIVPLSAGLDSRTLLALLLEHPDLDSKQLQTVTFGTPGTWDYEIGQQVAATAGVQNYTVDLTSESFDWSISELEAYARTLSSPTRVFEGFVNWTIAEKFEGATFWSGFMGDLTAGAHQPTNPREDWDTACEYFSSWNKRTNLLSSNDYNPTSALPDDPYFPHNVLSYEEQLDYAHRQQCFIKPIVLPHPDRYCTPFTHPKWLSFSLNLPTNYRADRYLFKQIVTKKFPLLFELPTDAAGGYPLTASSSQRIIGTARRRIRRKIMDLLNRPHDSLSINYVDFDKKFRQSCQLKESAKFLIEELETRDIDLSIEPHVLWEQHQKGQNRSTELRILCSIELYIRARS